MMAMAGEIFAVTFWFAVVGSVIMAAIALAYG